MDRIPNIQGQASLQPFAEREYVSMERVCRILGLSWSAVWRLTNENPPRLEVIDYRFRSRKRVHYASIVKLCDDLRARFGIADRRPQLSAPYLRHKDEDLLPFPLSDTISMQRAAEALGYERGEPLILDLVRRGSIDAYQFTFWSPWRISSSSLAAHIERSRCGTMFITKKGGLKVNAASFRR